MINYVLGHRAPVTFRGCKENMTRYMTRFNNNFDEAKVYECDNDDFCNGSVRRWGNASLLFVLAIVVRYIA